MIAGKGKTACALMTEHAREVMVSEANDPNSGMEIHAKDCASAVAAGAVIARAFGVTPESTKLTTQSVILAGNTATINATVSAETGTSKLHSKMIRGNSGWKLDDLGEADDPSEVNKAKAKGWVANWCKLKKAMTKAQVIKVMGEPTGGFDGSGGEAPQMNYNGYGYNFTVFLDINDRVSSFFVGDVPGSNPKPACSLGRA